MGIATADLSSWRSERRRIRRGTVTVDRIVRNGSGIVVGVDVWEGVIFNGGRRYIGIHCR